MLDNKDKQINRLIAERKQYEEKQNHAQKSLREARLEVEDLRGKVLERSQQQLVQSQERRIQKLQTELQAKKVKQKQLDAAIQEFSKRMHAYEAEKVEGE